MRPVDDLRALQSVGLNPTIVITEWGCDDNYDGGKNGVFLPFGIRTRGWRSCGQIWDRMGWTQGRTHEQFMLDAAKWYCQITGFDILIYAHGDMTRWNEIPNVFDTRGLL